MKRYLLLFSAVLILSANVLFAQKIKWDSAPKTGFVFQISNDEAQKFLTKSNPDTIINSLLHTQIDTFNVDKGWINRPDKGHFILVKIIENKLHCEYTSVFPYQVLLLKEYNALSLQVLDLDGNVRRDARVKFRTRKIRFDDGTNTYRIEHEWFGASSKTVTVELDGFRSVFNIDKHEALTWDNNYYNEDDGPDFYSYMITDKNKYKPGERVRFKSYSLSGSRNPIRRNLELWLSKSGTPLRIGIISPYRPGSFSGEFYLHDSLKLILDQSYSLQLRDRSGRVVSNCQFKYEDHELNGNRLQVRLDTSTHFYPASNYVKILATSENGLALKDARASVAILTENIRDVFQPLVTLPDTLMMKEIFLDSDEETMVEIPSSLFQKSNTMYSVHVVVLNSQNQRMEASEKATHVFSQFEIIAAYSNDSILYQILDKGKSMQNVPVKSYRDGATQAINITLPFKEKINPALSIIRFESEFVSRTIRLEQMLPRLNILGGIQKDSFNISIDNPQRIPLTWLIYQGSELLKKGSGADVKFKSKIVDRTNTFYIELLYSFGGSDHITSKEFEFREGSLNISLNIPDRVYPGQKVNATIHVSDDEGNPVSGVDLTAMATTAKLNYFLPDLPYYGSTSYKRPDKATYSKNEVNKKISILDLDYRRWASRARLDTMKYFQFIYPGRKFFIHQEVSEDSTQFAPFVIKDGEARAIYVIEVDRKPVYFSWTDHPKGYSFYVEPGKEKHITLRLYDKVLILDWNFDAGKKTIFSIDLDHLPEGVRVQSITPKMVKHHGRRSYKKWVFTEMEITRYKEYLATFTESTNRAYLIAKREFVPLSTGRTGERSMVVGPISPGIKTYVEEGGLQTTYRHAGGFSYKFEDNIVYKTEALSLCPDHLSNLALRPITLLNDAVINKQIFLKSEPYQFEKWHPGIIDLVDYDLRVKLLLPYEEAQSGVASVLFQNCKTGVLVWPCKTYSGTPDYFTIPRGCHHMIVLYNNGFYSRSDNVNLQSNFNVVADMRYQVLHPADSVSRGWLHEDRGNCFGSIVVPTRTVRIRNSGRTTGNLHGTLFDEANQGLPGATVVVKGTTIGAVTDIDGRFSLEIPDDPSTLIVSFIGYMTKEIEVRPGSEISVVMEPDVMRLQELVVVGYGTQVRKELTGSISYVLSGRVAGVSISHPIEPVAEEEERGEDQKQIAEEKLYRDLLLLNELRTQFSDVGFWEPRLVTDRNGVSSFDVTFPDDITRWDAIVYGMNRRLQTGTARRSIKSYKPLMAELHVPQFLIVGDSTYFKGTILNYTSDKVIEGTVKWSGHTSKQNSITFTDYHPDELPIVATSSDSIATSFSFTRNDGYLDGEERKVPIIEAGTIRAKGTLSVLQNKDEVHVQPKKGEVVQVEILDNPLEVYTEDVRNLVRYKYDCNEQLASKLIGLLNHKLITSYEGKPFGLDKDVNKIIQRLLKNQNSEFLWSWWDVSSNTSYWMSAHILHALKAAQDAGYSVNLDLKNVVRKATYKYEFLKDISIADVQIIHALAVWNAPIDYAHFVKVLENNVQVSDSLAHANGRRLRRSLLHEKFLLLEVRQLQNLPLVRDSLLHYKKETILNEVYFADGMQSRDWYSGELLTNAIAYRIVKRDSLLKQMSIAMQMYFLSSRKKGIWNTYESSNVLMSILPDLLAQGSSKKIPALVSLSGKMNGEVKKFPYKIELKNGEQVNVRKESGAPLYLMQFTEERVKSAKTGTDGFQIETTFSQKILRAGNPSILKVIIKVKKDADLEHAMIEIPIPGGCSYADKPQVDNGVETHREYFKDRTVIFCERMTPGTYIFQVPLLPRFRGIYHVNPAQVSLMYFPVVNANTEMAKIRINQ